MLYITELLVGLITFNLYMYVQCIRTSVHRSTTHNMIMTGNVLPIALTKSIAIDD